MKEPGRIESTIGWLLVAAVLTFVLYLPVWFAVGWWLYPNLHPDYWAWATPDHIFPISGALSAGLVLSFIWAWKRFA